MKQTAIFPGRYVQREGALLDLGEEAARLGTNALVVAGGTALESIVPTYQDLWSERFKMTLERFGGECSDDEIDRLTGIAHGHQCDLVIGFSYCGIKNASLDDQSQGVNIIFRREQC